MINKKYLKARPYSRFGYLLPSIYVKVHLTKSIVRSSYYHSGYEKDDMKLLNSYHSSITWNPTP